MERTYRLISGDSHLQVPADFWTHRVPDEYRELAPRRVKRPGGGEAIVAANGESYWGATGSYAGALPVMAGVLAAAVVLPVAARRPGPPPA